MIKNSPALKNEIIQHNNLIEAHYRLTLQEKRLVLWLASQVKREDDDFKVHTLTISKFAEITRIERDGAYKELPQITEKLMQKIIKIRSLEKDELLQVAWLNSARYRFKEGRVILRFSSDLKPFLLQIKEKYTKASLEDLLILKSIYAIRIYELLKQYESIGERIISVVKLRECCGIRQDQYKKYNDFKKKVLDISKREINEKTDLLISYEEVKTSRKITSINFTIKHNPDYRITEFERMQKEKSSIIRKELRSEKALIERIMEYGFTRQTAQKFIKTSTEKTVEHALKSVDIQVERGNVKNPKAMLKKAILEQWNPEVFKKKPTRKI